MTKERINHAVFVLFCGFTLFAPWILPVFFSEFWVDVYAEILIWSLFAASVNLLLGYVGLLSFGQALFFGMGMYGVAIGISKFGLGFWSAFGLGISLAVVMSVITGALAVRLTWHYFAIITVIFSLIFYFLALSYKPLTGGDDGIVFDMPPLISLGEWEISLLDPTVRYFFIVAVVGLCFYLKYRVLQSPLGRAFIAVRENDMRASLIGLNTYALRLTAFVMAGVLAGVAGALFAFYGQYASATYMFYQVSGEGVVWVILGGAGTLFGPVIGTSMLFILREELSSVWEHYQLIVGVSVILVVIFAPKGVVGLWNLALDRFADNRKKVLPPENLAPGDLRGHND